MTPQGRTKEKKENVFPAIIFDTIRQAVKTPAMIAYKSVLVKSSNMSILYFQSYINFTSQNPIEYIHSKKQS